MLNQPMNKRVAIALSGGVDSCVGAALLIEQGYQVEGATMRLLPSWMDSAHDDETVARAQLVFETLGIAHHVIDLRELFEQQVVCAYACEYGAARTPNPCVICNEQIKFGALGKWADGHGFDFLATGHYAARGGIHLRRGADHAKDQTYFMYRISRARLSRVLFPLATHTKTWVRHYAASHNLPSAHEGESQDACFVDRKGRHDIVRHYCPHAYKNGDIVTTAGEVIGTHQGIAHYTVGQRRGIGIGGSGNPYYVVAIDKQLNQVVVGQRDAASFRVLECGNVVADTDALGGAEGVWSVSAVARYRMQPAQAKLQIFGDRMAVTFQNPVEGISAGQSAVCYKDEVVVAGGIIVCVH